MRKLATAAIAAGLIATSSTGLIAPAAAHADTGTAVIAGLIGVGIVAAIASSHHHHHRHRYEYTGYPRQYYGPPAYDDGAGFYGYDETPRHYGHRYDDDDE